MQIPSQELTLITNILLQNKVLALPTDTVIGLSTVINEKAIASLAELKKRSVKKGFIIISGTAKHLLKYIDTKKLTKSQLDKLQSIQDKPTTWVAPVKQEYKWLNDNKENIAVRLTSNSWIKEITDSIDQAITSTSANLSGNKTATNKNQVFAYFGNKIYYSSFLDASMSAKASQIIDIRTGIVLRD